MPSIEPTNGFPTTIRAKEDAPHSTPSSVRAASPAPDRDRIATGSEQLGLWLEDHNPQSREPFAPTNTYCTQYVEDAIQKATGYDLYGAVAEDTAQHDPGIRLTGTVHDGYRYSSSFNPTSYGKDPYNSDNVAHFFANEGELHKFAGNHGMQVGDILFLKAKTRKGWIIRLSLRGLMTKGE